MGKSWPYDLVEIVWVDASGDTGWKAESEIKEETTTVTTVGFLIRKTKKHYLIGASIFFEESDDEHHFGDRNHIPRGMVKSITVLVPKSTGGLPADLAVRIAPGGNA